MKRTLIASFALALLAVSSRADDQTLSLAPAVVMLRGEYGQSTTQTLTLSNATRHSFTFDLVARDVMVRNGKRVFVPAGELAGSIAATAVFSQKRVVVPPGDSALVNVTVTLPHDTPARAIVVLFSGVNKILSGGTPMTASLGTLLTFNVGGSVELTAKPAVIRPQTSAVNFAISQQCANSGSDPLVTRGVMAVVDAQGKLVGTSPLDSRRLLPGETTEFQSEYGGELSPGRYRVLLTYDFEGKSLTQSADLLVQ